jgi:2-polyprenyl-6-hydroxyphenyl methylase/3-demethylubiquinone-9 3-methyltransferase
LSEDDVPPETKMVEETLSARPVTTEGPVREIAQGRRFSFGSNWTAFLSVLTSERIVEAERSLREMLGCQSLQGKTFLDAGCGSGLFSLAARRLGAAVSSFDYDPESVACAYFLKRQHFRDDPKWAIGEGSVLDESYLRSLDTFDVVYSWGVLHHTGNMWRALEIIDLPVKPGGQLFLSIYNDQGNTSKRWRVVKRFYCSGLLGRGIVCGVFIPYFVLGGLVVDLLNWQSPLRRYSDYLRTRGMSRVHDWFDWLGGYPFEVAKPEQIIEYYFQRGYVLQRLVTTNGLGCNQFVFRKISAA